MDRRYGMDMARGGQGVGGCSEFCFQHVRLLLFGFFPARARPRSKRETRGNEFTASSHLAIVHPSRWLVNYFQAIYFSSASLWKHGRKNGSESSVRALLNFAVRLHITSRKRHKQQTTGCNSSGLPVIGRVRASLNEVGPTHGNCYEPVNQGQSYEAIHLNSSAIRCEQHAGHETQRPVPLRHDVRLHVAVVVLARPHKPT